MFPNNRPDPVPERLDCHSIQSDPQLLHGRDAVPLTVLAPALSPPPKALHGRQETGESELERGEKCVATGLSHPQKNHGWKDAVPLVSEQPGHTPRLHSLLREVWRQLTKGTRGLAALSHGRYNTQSTLGSPHAFPSTAHSRGLVHARLPLSSSFTILVVIRVTP